MTGPVAIIGAGIAGLALGRRLREAGRDVVVFDKARGAGGRVSTRRNDWGSFDHGAQYFTARDARFQAQVEDWIGRGVVAPWDGRVVSLSRGVVRAQAGPATTRHVGVPGMSAIARDLARGLALETGVRIERVERGGRGWRLVSDFGQAFPDLGAVVCAVPAPQAVPFLTASLTLTSLARSVEFLACHALMLRPERPLEPGFDAAFVEDSPIGWIARQSGKPGREAHSGWLVHSTPQWSAAHVDLPGEQVAQRLTGALAEALGSELPRSEQVAVHRWLYARAARPLDVGACWDAEAGLGICGDWLRGDRVEDAYLSALELAAMMDRSDPVSGSS